MTRKVARDLSGASRNTCRISGIMMMHLRPYIRYSLGGLVERLDQKGRTAWDVLKTGGIHLYGPLLMNALLLGIFIAIGKPWLYLLWIGSILTTAILAARVRSFAEHSVIPDPNDPFNNTRTTYARWYERLLFAPHRGMSTTILNTIYYVQCLRTTYPVCTKC